MQDKNKDFSRRDFIKKSVAGMGFLVVLSSPLTFLLKRAMAKNSVPGVVNNTSGAAVNGEKMRAWSMVIDLKKCEGCVTIDAPPQCTQACTLMHYVPKGQEWIQVFEVELPGGGSYFLPTPCMHCENAPCVNVCPVAATYHTKEGLVLIDQRRCIGCRMCMAACPYQRRFFNWGEPELPPEAASIEYSPEHQIPAIRGTVMKCDFCPEMLHRGKPPACVTGCPMKAIYMGDLTDDIASNGRDIVQLSRFLDENNAYRYKEDLGTQPRLWYLPGHGEAYGRRSDDERQLQPPTWTWGGEGYDRKVGIWPWRDD
ncbi:4Fe-4S dicluster domain-containing protein [Chloroflexota bacterium]